MRIVQTRFKARVDSSRETQVKDVLSRNALSALPVSDPYVRRIKPGVAYCRICNKEFASSARYFGQHVKGAKHKQAVVAFEANQVKP